MAKLIYLTQNNTLGELRLTPSDGGFIGVLREPAFCLYVSKDNGIVTDLIGFTEKEQACFKSPHLLSVAKLSDSDFRKENSNVTFFFNISGYKLLHTDSSIQPVLTGTASMSRLKQIKIPAGTFTKAACIKVLFGVKKSNNVEMSMRFYISDDPNVNGAYIYGYLASDATSSVWLRPEFVVKDRSFWYWNTNQPNFTATNNAWQIGGLFDPSKDYYLNFFVFPSFPFQTAELFSSTVELLITE